MQLDYIVKKDCELKTFLLENNFSKRYISKLLLEKQSIFINGKVYNTDYKLHIGDKITIIQKENTSIIPVCGDLQIVYEDEYFLVVNKPKNMAVIPTIAHYNDSLANRVLYYFNSHNIKSGIHIVNRLDIVTSGLVIFAKSNYIHSLFSNIQMEKRYKCTVCGHLENKYGIINSKIAKSKDGIKREVSNYGKEAITIYNVLEEYENSSLLDIELKTGRTHQIRVHLSSIGHPIVGDILYGGRNGEFNLCSYYIAFTFPLNNKHYEFVI